MQVYKLYVQEYVQKMPQIVLIACSKCYNYRKSYEYIARQRVHAKTMHKMRKRTPQKLKKCVLGCRPVPCCFDHSLVLWFIIFGTSQETSFSFLVFTASINNKSNCFTHVAKKRKNSKSGYQWVKNLCNNSNKRSIIRNKNR